jgi:hypothetical protein
MGLSQRMDNLKMLRVEDSRVEAQLGAERSESPRKGRQAQAGYLGQA